MPRHLLFLTAFLAMILVVILVGFGSGRAGRHLEPTSIPVPSVQLHETPVTLPPLGTAPPTTSMPQNWAR